MKSLLRALGSRVPPPAKRLIRQYIYDVPIQKWHPTYQRCPLLQMPDVYLDLVPGDMLSELITMTGTYEPELTAELLRLGARGGRMVQVGANIGYFCVIWAASSEGNEVFAVEPHLDNIASLRRNARLNGKQDRIHILPVAASRETGLTLFDDGPDEQRGHGGISAAGRLVPAMTLDALLAGVDKVDVLLIDTEGADTWVLEGATQLLIEKRIDAVYFEQNWPRMSQLGIERTAAEEVLSRVGYKCERWHVTSDTVEIWRALPTA